MNKIVIDSGIWENRIAILEDDELVDIYVDRIDDQRITGNIYLGRVVNILPGMQAAFVDIGLKKNAFIHLKDALPRNITENENFDIRDYSIEKVLKNGQDILVQVNKEGFNTKGPKVSVQLSLTGKYAVIMDGTDYRGVSRKIVSNKERERLREIASKVISKDKGLVIRTVSMGESEKKISEDIKFLVAKLDDIKQRAKISKPPKLISDLNIEQKVLRDFLNNNIDQIIVNNKEVYDSFINIFNVISEESIDKLIYFDKSHDVFGYLGIETMIENAVKREVRLKNGASIVIDENEALTTIDVNTAKCVGDSSLADTVLQVNIEAAREIAKQLRLRNIGGIIIIDFIGMKLEKHEKKIIDILKEELKKDRNTTNVLGMTKLGLVEMTRKKTIGRLTTRMLRKCPCCDGFGKVDSEYVVIKDIQNESERAYRNTKAKCIAIEVNPIVIEFIEQKYQDFYSDIKKLYDIKIILRSNEKTPYGYNRILRMGSVDFVESYVKQLDREGSKKQLK